MNRIVIIAVSLLSVFIFSEFTMKNNTNEAGVPGEAMFKKYSCTSCHGNTGTGKADLRNAWQKYTDEQIRKYIKNPSAFNNRKMPPFGSIINENDLNVLVEYVKFLGKKK